MPPSNNDYLKKFLALPYVSQPPVGSPPQVWAKHVKATILDSLPTTQLSRSALRRFCMESNSIESCFIAIMAWGAMGTKNGRLVWKARENWSSISEKLRAENPTRKDAFDEFTSLRDRQKLPGMRAPYFTKLIFFLRPKDDGYIMDRWTAKSVNAIFEKIIVKRNTGGWVTDENDSTDYERFCMCIDELAAIYSQRGISRQDFPNGFRGDQVEELIFSKPRSEWRKLLG